MDSLYARIRRDYLLRGWSDSPTALVDRWYGNFVIPCEAYDYVLRSCDGECDLSSPAFTPAHRRQLEWLVRQGYVEPCARGDGPDAVQKYLYTPCPRLTTLSWAITEACNLHCVHCFMESPDKADAVEADGVARILREIERAHVPFVSLTGGEPLLSPHFRDIVRGLSEAGTRITEISTNATLLNDDVLDALLDCDQRPDLLVSYDGCGVHDAIRGARGLEHRVLRAAEFALSRGFIVVIVTTLMAQNIDALPPTYAKLKALMPSGWFINRAQSTGLYRNERRLSTAEAAQACSALHAAWLRDGRPFPVIMEQFQPGQRNVCYTPDSPECAGNTCSAFLLPDGTLMPCPGFVGTAVQSDMPNILRDGLIEAWSSKAILRFRGAKKASRLAKNPRCAKCPHFEACGMGCRAYALTEAGSIDGRDPDTCEIYTQNWRDTFYERERRAPL